MGERIKVVKSPTLIVDAAGTGFDDFTASIGSGVWSYNSTTGAVITPVIDGEILKVVLNFTSTDANAVLTISTRDTPSENIIEVTDWQNDLTIYPVIEGLLNTGGAAAAANKSNVFQKYAVHGTMSVDCTAGTDNDTVVIRIYYR